MQGHLSYSSVYFEGLLGIGIDRMGNEGPSGSGSGSLMGIQDEEFGALEMRRREGRGMTFLSVVGD